MKRFLDYNKKLKERTKELRKNMTAPEKKIWFGFFQKINSGEIKLPLIKGDAEGRGIIFTKDDLKGKIIRILRQRPIDNFIVDFYIPKLKLVIEIDGDSHFDNQGKAYDIERTQILEGFGLKVIRFTNNEIMKNFDGVCFTLEKIIFGENDN